MEIPIPSFDDVMNFLKSDTGKEVVEMTVPELQGPLAGADVGLIMQVINSQNPREGTSSSSDFPPLPPPVQGPLLDTNTDLVTEVINSQNPRETRIPQVEAPVPTMTVPELSPELSRRAGNSRSSRRFA